VFISLVSIATAGVYTLVYNPETAGKYDLSVFLLTGAAAVCVRCHQKFRSNIMLMPPSWISLFESISTAGGLKGYYYDNTWFLNAPVQTRVDPTINFQVI
jgi:hypothetical protein